LFAKGEKVVKKGLYFTQVSVLTIHAKGGESISPKQKDRTTPKAKGPHHHQFSKFKKVLK
jgi:hypothetical protein